MEHLLLVKTGEIFLKGLNRPVFEKKLMDNIKNALNDMGTFNIRKEQGRIYIEILDSIHDEKAVAKRVTNVFGIVAVVFALRINADLEEIMRTALDISKKAVERHGYRTFKVETNRPNKAFSPDSMEVSRKTGEYVLDNNPALKVDVHQPELTIRVEIRDKAYLYYEIIRGRGGMPVGSSGKGLLLLSGGIDSPVAGYMMAKRGMSVDAVHFHSHPYTTEKSREKVITLAKKMKPYTGSMRLCIVNFTKAQLEIYEKCPHGQLTVIMRRLMMKIAREIARSSGTLALITGEALGQVASQTLESIVVTDQAVEMPIFRPLLGMDKIEVIRIAEDIGTYDTSILPYEDCCTVFVARHPETRPRLDKILKSEENIDMDRMVEECLSDLEFLEI
ncbi:MAG: tRNA uracil 4-sulfurtransferase ThiI [Clostridia bacterium]